MIFNLFKKNRTQQEFRYLQNPYFQLNCWLQYRAQDPLVGEEVLKLVIELKELCLKFDAMNKQRFKESFNTWHPYNVWVDVIVSEYLNRDIERLKERISIRKKKQNEYASFRLSINVIGRIIGEKSAFEHAFPSEQLENQFYALLNRIRIYDEFFMLPNHASGGGELRVFSSYLKDEREIEKVRKYCWSKTI